MVPLTPSWHQSIIDTETPHLGQITIKHEQALILLKFRSPLLDELHYFHGHFQIRFGASGFKAPMQAFGEIDAQARHRLFFGGLLRFPLFRFRGNVGMCLPFFPARICGRPGPCILSCPAALEGGDDLSRERLWLRRLGECFAH